MSKQRDSGGGLEELFALIAIAIIGLIAGAWFASWQKKKNTVHLPETLEGLPTNPKPPFTWSDSDLTALGVGSTSALLLLVGLNAAHSAAIFSLLLFAGAFAAGYFAVKMWQDSQSRKPPPPLPPQPEPFNLNKASVYTIALPRSTPWQPEVAYRFMEQILHAEGGA
jgi:uncharacterized membrane protein YebE (DUF533 family)